MSSTGRIGEDVSSQQSRRPTRERKQAQHFGHSQQSEDLEELIEAANPGKIAPAVRKGGKRASGKPSLLVTLPLPAPTVPQAPLLPSAPSASAPKIKVEDDSEAQSGPSSLVSKKRSAALIADNDDSELFTPTSSKGPAPKKQRVQPATRKPRAAPRAKVAVKSEVDERPEPRGQPEVWAEERPALCEALPYFNAWESSSFHWGGHVYGLLVDNDNERGYMDEKTVITRTSGGVKINTKTGKMEQMVDQSSTSTKFTVFLNNKERRVPIILIVGAKNEHCPTRVPHRFNVMGLFHVTDAWAERVNGVTVCRVRYEMIDLKAPSWWGVKGSPLPPRKPDYRTKVPAQTCSACGTTSKQRYAVGWMCANEACTSFSHINGEALNKVPAYNPVFLAERTKWPAKILPPMPFKPAPPAGLSNPEMSTSHSAWKGMVCQICGRCNSRTHWDEWKCETDGCTYEIPIHHTIHKASALAPQHAFEAEGHAISFNKWESPVVCKEDFIGYWRKETYELSPGNFISHYHANLVINRQPGGADEMLEALQGARMGMMRHPLEHSPVEGVSLTRHFGTNFGLPYNFIASPDTQAFSQAPAAIMDALNRLTWAGKDAVKDGSYRPFNELLCLGYMEDQRIKFHDDGEKDLGPDIASISLGGAAKMEFRMKGKYWIAKGLTAQTYDPNLPVRPGSQAWELRTAANELYQAGRMDEYKAAKAELFRALKNDKRKHGPSVLTLELRHGDMVVMHGEEIQLVFEHGVVPKGKLRFGLTGRYIKPENIPVEEHWKGDFTIAPDKVYDGDMALFKAEERRRKEEAGDDSDSVSDSEADEED